ncbi:hypothetical protein P7K49_022769 [Saguinus oedipus]|uniref:Uncharacterized protein n=1 Tax=Saguinus oedipus TaxID=9490 RepID=A0ABQ9UJU8_SAGOE|nr:hypothetical protein P7K49_022769 [Saguinus oedipus]
MMVLIPPAQQTAEPPLMFLRESPSTLFLGLRKVTRHAALQPGKLLQARRKSLLKTRTAENRAAGYIPDPLGHEDWKERPSQGIRDWAPSEEEKSDRPGEEGEVQEGWHLGSSQQVFGALPHQKRGSRKDSGNGQSKENAASCGSAE